MEKILKYIIIFKVEDEFFETPLDIDIREVKHPAREEIGAEDIMEEILKHCVKETKLLLDEVTKDDIHLLNVCKL